ncbi:MAG: 50S ribosomal protein L9 [Gammaproteobacteria bacterium]|nr:MAG: 50S ribosomal protein L9 [Gammaproteobacteria bacterium]
MDVILLDKLPKLGDIGQKVSVKPGYARNYLFPKGKAVPATPENMAVVEARRAELEQAAREALAAARVRSEQILQLDISIARRAGAEGKLFGSVGTAEIAQAITEAGVPVERHEVRLAEGPLRTLGEHEITLHLHSEVEVPITITIIAET